MERKRLEDETVFNKNSKGKKKKGYLLKEKIYVKVEKKKEKICL